MTDSASHACTPVVKALGSFTRKGVEKGGTEFLKIATIVNR